MGLGLRLGGGPVCLASMTSCNDLKPKKISDGARKVALSKAFSRLYTPSSTIPD